MQTPQYETNLIYRKLDENGDRLFGQNKNDFLSGLDAMRQVLETRLKAIRNEWWEGDPSALPWMTDILTAYATEQNREIIDLMVIARIQDTKGVTGIVGFSSSLQDRHYSFTATVTTVYGETEVSA